jgi:hypothetical protein
MDSKTQEKPASDFKGALAAAKRGPSGAGRQPSLGPFANGGENGRQRANPGGSTAYCERRSETLGYFLGSRPR